MATMCIARLNFYLFGKVGKHFTLENFLLYGTFRCIFINTYYSVYVNEFCIVQDIEAETAISKHLQYAGYYMAQTAQVCVMSCIMITFNFHSEYLVPYSQVPTLILRQ